MFGVLDWQQVQHRALDQRVERDEERRVEHHAVAFMRWTTAGFHRIW